NYLPEPTHIDPNHANIDKSLVKLKKYADLNNFRMPIAPKNNLPKWITVKDALSDLPGLFPSSTTPYKLNKMDMKLPYQTPPINDCQKKMRRMSDNSFTEYVESNCVRRTIRDFRIFERMKQGEDYRQAHRIAMKIFEEAL